jgi:hypothetical protein
MDDRAELKDSHYLHVILPGIGERLRGQYDLKQPLPGRLLELLLELEDESGEDNPMGSRGDQPGT